jgi:RNA polymerase sigma-70 factor (ECF subfamily)
MGRGAVSRERDVREAYAANSGELYGLAVRSLGDVGLAEEAVQETFLRAWRGSDHFDPAAGSLRTRLFSILRDVVIELGRARATRPRVADKGVDLSVDTGEELLLAGRVEQAMRRIDEQYRQVVVETYYRGRPYAEVATELGVPEKTVRCRTYHALRALKVALEEVGFES